MKLLSRAGVWLLLLILVGLGWAQQRPVPGPEALSIPGPAPVIHAPFGGDLSALESFFRGAFPQAGARHDFSQLVNWSASPANIISVDNTGDISTLATTTCPNGCAVTVTATYRGLRASMDITVWSPQSVSIVNVSKTPLNPLPQGEFQQLDAIATYGDNFTCTPPPPNMLAGCNLTSQPSVTWSSTNDAVVLHNAKNIPGLVEAVAQPSGPSATISCAFFSSPCTNTVTITTAPPGLLFVVTVPRDINVDVGKKVTFTAQGHYSAAGPPVMIASISRNGSSVASVTTASAHGLSTGEFADIAGVSDPSFDGTFFITVTSATTFTYGNAGAMTGPILNSGTADLSSKQDLPFTEPGGSMDTVSFTSSDPSKATIIANTGVATGVAAGITQISAQADGKSAFCLGAGCLGNLDVGLMPNAAPNAWTISPAPGSDGTVHVAKGSSPNPPPPQQFTVMGSFSDSVLRDITDSVFWCSAAPTVASVTTAPSIAPNGGTVTAITPGQTAVITAGIPPPGQACPNGPLSISTMVTAEGPELVSIAVTPATPNIPFGASQQFTATGTFSDGSKQNLTSQVTFNSDTPSVLSFIGGAAGSPGLGHTGQTGQNPGNANVTVSSASCVGPPTACAPSVPVKVGPATVAAIRVTPRNTSLPSGDTLQFTAQATYTDGTKQDLPFKGDPMHAMASVNWSSSALNQATINPSGNATAIGESGVTNIKATLASGTLANSVRLTVVPAKLVSISLTPTSPANLPAGLTQQFTATGTFSDNSTQDFTDAVTWNSDSANAGISSSGLATGESVGAANISATYSGCVAPGCAITPVKIPLNIVAPTLNSIAVYLAPCPVPPMGCPSAATLTFGQQKPFVAIGTFSAAPTTQDITSTVNWSTSDQSVATIDASGLATAAGAGTASVIATDPVTGKSSSDAGGTSGMLTVSLPTLMSVTVMPANSTAPLNGTQQYTALGLYSDNSQQDLTSRVTWSTQSGGSIAGIDSSGLLTGNSVGRDTVMAACPNDGACQPMSAPGPVNGSTSVTVSF